MAALSWFVKTALSWAWGKLSSWASALIAKFLRRKEITKQEEASVEPLKKADPESEKEIDDSIHDALDDL